MIWNSNEKGYACKSKDNDIRIKSSSGGIFYYLAKTIIEEGGYVCGCVYDADFMPRHIVSNKISDVKLMMGSKYATSNWSGCISEMEQLLSKGEKVLFSGVPCQIAAVKKSLGKYGDLLICVSVVCHGTFDRKIWAEYLKQVKKDKKIASVTMRDKSKGWSNYGLKIVFDDDSSIINYRKEDGYLLKCFTDGVLEREPCLKCAFKRNRIEADLLLGDGWKMESVYPEMEDTLGTSLVVVITALGKKLFDSIKGYLDYRHIPVDKIVEMNPRIMTSEKDVPNRKKFKRDFEKRPSDVCSLLKKYAKPSYVNRAKNLIGRVIKRR